MNLAQRIKEATGCNARSARTLAAAIVARDEWAVKEHHLVAEVVCGDGCCSYGYAALSTSARQGWGGGKFFILNESMEWQHD